MRMRARAVPLRASAAALAVVAGGCGGDAAPRVPSSYATYARDGVEFRYPRGWLVERAAPTASARSASRAVVRLRPSGSNPDRPGPQVTLRIVALEEGFDAFARRGLRSPDGAPGKSFALEVPGADESRAERSTSAGRRRSSVVARAGEGTGVSLEAVAPRGGGALDPEAVVGSLRLAAKPP